MFYSLLILGHLVADFILQPEKLVKWKYASWRGIVVHAFIHAGINLLLLFSVWNDSRVLLLVLGLAIAHFFIDKLKILLEPKFKVLLIPFFGDQILHLMTIVIGVNLLGLQDVVVKNIFGQQIYDFKALVVLILVIMVSYVVEMIWFQIQRIGHRQISYCPNYALMLQRTMVVLAFALLLV